jgi:hypothetical protein
MKNFGLAVVFLSIALPAFADYSEICKSQIDQDANEAVKRKMSKTQIEKLRHLGDNLCLEKTLTELHRESVEKKTISIEKMTALNASYCGPGHEASDRARECLRAASEIVDRVHQRDAAMNDVVNEDRRIRRMESEYQTALHAKAQPERKVDPAIQRREVAAKAIAKVKRDILEAMKDPDSAKFRRITTSPDGSLVCGEVNAKNAMGGYVGFRKFVNVDDKGLDFFFYEEAGNAKLIETCELQLASQKPL